MDELSLEPLLFKVVTYAAVLFFIIIKAANQRSFYGYSDAERIETRTIRGGIAHALSLHSFPPSVARSISPAETFVTPIQSIYESTSLVICSAKAGMPSDDAGKYLVCVSIMAGEKKA